MRSLLLLSSVAAVLACATPAGAVVGGTPIDPATVPWFVSLPGCGGTLVAPDRVLTAGHCVDRELPVGQRLGAVAVGATTHAVAGLAMHPGWRRMNWDNRLEDVALILLSEPVTDVRPIDLGGTGASGLRIIGAGRTSPPGGRGTTDVIDGLLRQAPLRTMSE